MNDNTNNIGAINGALERYDVIAAGLADMVKRYGGLVFDVSTSEGMTHAKLARKDIRDVRYEVESVRKAAKSPLLNLGRALDTKAQEITREILKLEKPIDDVILGEENRLAAIRQAEIDKEAARVTDIQARIGQIRAKAEVPTNASSELIQCRLNDLARMKIDPAHFEEFQVQATDALLATIAKLKEIGEAALVREANERAAAAKQKADAAELERLRIENARLAALQPAPIPPSSPPVLPAAGPAKNLTAGQPLEKPSAKDIRAACREGIMAKFKVGEHIANKWLRSIGG